MTALYQSLLKLYPRLHRYAFGDEMLAVFLSAEADAREKGLGQRTAFYLREIAGLVGGAARERLRDLEEFHVELFNNGGSMSQRNGCQFPRSAIFLMVVVFVIVLEIIAKVQGMVHYVYQANSVNGQIVTRTREHWDLGNSVRYWPSHYGLISGIAVCFAIAWIIGVAAWGVSYAMRRTGAQRLGEFQTWPLEGK